MKYQEIWEQLDLLISTMEENAKIKRMRVLREKIEKDEKLRELLEYCRNTKEEYSNNYINAKREIIDNTYVSEYRILENELYFMVLDMNQEFNKLINRGGCSL